MNIDLKLGDCIEVLKTIPDNSIDSIVTDPPYGLEFMGKEWDKFAPSKTNQERWEGKRTEMFQRDIKMPGTGFKQLPTSFGKKQNKKCLKCGHYFYSGTPCKCDEPEWEMRENKFNKGFQDFCKEWAIECLRVLKPGGHLLAFGGSRTYHRMAVAVEDAGFEIRDQIMWVYGSGFPKSLNIGKAIDKKEGNEREVVGEKKNKINLNATKEGDKSFYESAWQNKDYVDLPVTKGNSEWEGWGTALKPAHEPIVLARKPLSEKSIAENVLKHGTGGINIDGSRIEFEDTKNAATNPKFRKEGGYKMPEPGQESNGAVSFTSSKNEYDTSGRFPANIIFDEEAGQLLDEQSDKASRFFYCPKASKKDRNEGLDDFEEKIKDRGVGRTCSVCNKFILSNSGPRCECGENRIESYGTTKNNHPTVKPTDLMRYLINLITPKGGTTLDPFMGSGSTGKAAVRCGVNFIGIEKEEEYMKIAEARINHEKNKTTQGKLF